MIVAATGHRPERLGGYGDDVRLRLKALARKHLIAIGASEAISGIALGWDQAVADAALDLGLPLTAAVPFDGFGRRLWPSTQQDHFNLILDQCSTVHFVCDQIGPFKKSYDLRNRWMVDRADLMLGLWDGGWGGTFNCVQYAKQKGVPVQNLWCEWDRDLTEILN